MRQEIYWTLPNDGRTYRSLPSAQIDGQPIPTTWAGVGPARAKDFGAVECRRDLLPSYYTIPEGVDPWTEKEQDGVRVYSLDVSKLAHDEAAEMAALAEQVRTERDGLLRESDRSVLALERRIRLASVAGEDSSALKTELNRLDAYREALCALPESPGFPREQQWPERPE